MKQRLFFLIIISYSISLDFAVCQNHQTLPTFINDSIFTFILKFDSTDSDTLLFKRPTHCNELPSFLRMKSKKNEESRQNGAEIISFSVDPCVSPETIEKKSNGAYDEFKDQNENKFSNSTCKISDTTYFKGDTLFIHKNILYDCCVSFIGEILYTEDRKLILYYKVYSDGLTFCYCNYGLNYKILFTADDPHSIDIKEE